MQNNLIAVYYGELLGILQGSVSYALFELPYFFAFKKLYVAGNKAPKRKFKLSKTVSSKTPFKSTKYLVHKLKQTNVDK